MSTSSRAIDRRQTAPIGRYAVVLAMFMLVPAAVLAAEASACRESARVHTVISQATSRHAADSLAATWLGLIVADRVPSGTAIAVVADAPRVHEAPAPASCIRRAARASLIDLPPPSC